MAFIVYLRSILEYNCIIWSPCLKRKHWTTRKSATTVYWEIMNLWGLTCLKYGIWLTLRAALITLRSNLLLQRHPYKLYTAHCENLKRRNFFTERIVNVWNSLPKFVDFSSLPRCKESIARSIFCSFWSVMSYNHHILIMYFWYF